MAGGGKTVGGLSLSRAGGHGQAQELPLQRPGAGGVPGCCYPLQGIGPLGVIEQAGNRTLA